MRARTAYKRLAGGPGSNLTRVASRPSREHGSRDSDAERAAPVKLSFDQAHTEFSRQSLVRMCAANCQPTIRRL